MPVRRTQLRAGMFERDTTYRFVHAAAHHFGAILIASDLHIETIFVPTGYVVPVPAPVS
jgi:hypothetical protein